MDYLLIQGSIFMKKEFKGLSIKSNLLIFSFCISLIPIAIITTIYTLHARSKLMHHQLNKFLSEFKKPLDPQITAIAITDKDGIIVASSLKELAGEDISGQAIFRHAMSKKFGEAYVEQPGYMPLLKANTLTISAPVAYRIGTNRGILINYYDIAVLAEVTLDRVGLGNTGEVYLVNSDKKMITESRYINDAPLMLVVDTAPIRKIAEEGKEMVGIYADYRGIPVVGASAHIPEYGWTLLVGGGQGEGF